MRRDTFKLYISVGYLRMKQIKLNNPTRLPYAENQ